ncbi:hypothetical protein Ahy_B03g065649 [Arachis hypogaea]|uniref:Zinc finger GRF-type domain-containing protein n=1 Tax=Arachis hypogaea TaxID=3818 RepID=A0A445A2A9_ARAHY|nr:hypothetical protein Ahy_B03g065649 [Arachis hypogaea]
MASDACCSSTRRSRGGDGGQHELKVGYATLNSLQPGNVKDGVSPRFFCKKYAIFYMSKTNTNLNRLFFGCPLLKVKQPHYKFFVWVDDHIVRLRGVELTRALGDNKPNDDEEHLGKKELENMMANLEERIVKLEKRKSINCRGKGLEQLSSNASNSNDFGTQEVVSGFLYDKLQKEVVNLRKSCEVEDSNLQAKHEEIKMLTMKGDGLMEAMEVELKKMKREAAAREKEVSSSTTDEKKKTRSTTPLEGSIT